MPVVLAALVAGLAAGCGGDGDDDRGGTPIPTSRSASGTPVPGTQVGGTLASLNSYKCNIKIEGSGGPLSEVAALFGGANGAQNVAVDSNITYVKPDKSLMTVKVNDETYVQTTIGTQQWTAVGGLTIGPNAVGPQTAGDLSLCAAFWDEGFSETGDSFQCSGDRESLNGQQTRKCSIDRQTFEQIRQFLGGVLSDPDSEIRELTRFQMEMWVTAGTNNVPEGLPVRFRTDMAGKDASGRDFAMKVDLDVTNINDSGLSVSAPR